MNPNPVPYRVGKAADMATIAWDMWMADHIPDALNVWFETCEYLLKTERRTPTVSHLPLPVVSSPSAR